MIHPALRSTSYTLQEAGYTVTRCEDGSGIVATRAYSALLVTENDTGQWIVEASNGGISGTWDSPDAAREAVENWLADPLQD